MTQSFHSTAENEEEEETQRNYLATVLFTYQPVCSCHQLIMLDANTADYRTRQRWSFSVIYFLQEGAATAPAAKRMVTLSIASED